MPRQLPQRITFAKNQIETGSAWLAILDIMIPLAEPLYLRVVNNNENIFFGTPPQEYTAYAFSISLPKQSSAGEIGTTQLVVQDVGKTLRKYIEDLNGGYGTTVLLRVINTDYLTDTTDYAELSIDFDLMDAAIKDDNITFTLGAPNLLRQTFPPGRYIADHCQWISRFKGFECKYSGSETSCNGTRAQCRALGNTKNYGGFPGLADSSMRLA